MSRHAINTHSPTKRISSVKLDYFLYSCFEFEQTCKAAPHRALGSERWPIIIKFFEDDDNSVFSSIGNLEEQLNNCLDWYTESFTNLMTESQLDLTNINGIIPAVVFLGLDFKTVVLKDSTFEELAYKESNPNKNLWSLLESIIQKRVPSFSRQIIAYLQWAYAIKEDRQWDIGSRPPVGKYAPSYRKTRSGSGNQKERNTRDRNGNKRANGRPKREQHGKKGDHREKAALLDVNNAVKQMKKNPELAEVKLNPTNSFFRRLQHKHAISQGFESISSGEGNERSVVVKRGKETTND